MRFRVIADLDLDPDLVARAVVGEEEALEELELDVLDQLRATSVVHLLEELET